MSLTHLFFDAGNTLVYVNMEFVSEVLARHGARATAAELWEAEYRVRGEIDRPEVVKATNDHLRWTIYFQRIFARCGIADAGAVEAAFAELRDYHARSNLWEVVPDEVRATLDGLQGRYRMSVISNANGTVRDKLERVGLAPYFEEILDSHVVGIEKPDPRIFRRALEASGARPEASVYVGDLYHVDVIGARAAGMKAVLLDPAGVHGDKPVPTVPSLGALPGALEEFEASAGATSL